MGKVQSASFRRHFFYLLVLLSPIYLAIGLKNCSQNIAPPDQTGVLKVSVRPNIIGSIDLNTSWAGLEHRLLEHIAKELNLKLEWAEKDQFGALFSDIENGESHMAAANISVTSKRRQHFIFSEPYLSTRTLIITHASDKSIRSLEDLGNSLVVLSDSSYSHQLHALTRGQPELHWQEENLKITELLDQLEQKKIQASMIDENLFEMFKAFYPNIKVAFALNSETNIAFALPQSEAGRHLMNQINPIIQAPATQALIQKLQKQYLPDPVAYDPVGTFYFRKLSQSRLVDYVDYFKQAGKAYSLDWRLLAAIAYQESHWNPKAVSPTGVKGLMMLTQNTAKEMGIKNRMDPEQSIFAAAKYLQILLKKMPQRIESENRIWFALAAYNLGFRHLENARVLAQRSGKNPDLWHQVKPFFKQLSDQKTALELDSNTVDGEQAAHYVARIQTYYRFLIWLDA